MKITTFDYLDNQVCYVYKNMIFFHNFDINKNVYSTSGV